MPNNYVDNKKFWQTLLDHKRAKEKATAEGTSAPSIPNFVGECIYLIAQNFINYKYHGRKIFANYSFRDDMIGDAIENCLMYYDRFDPDRFKNPFAYFTKITYYAFIRRIKKEKKQSNIKTKLIISAGVLDDVYGSQDHDDQTYTNSYLEYLRGLVNEKEMDGSDENKADTRQPTHDQGKQEVRDHEASDNSEDV